MANWMSDLFQNKLFLQYLANAGGAMSAGEPIGPALNQVTQQNISAQNFAKMLAQLMGDANNAATPGKISTDGKKFSYSTDLGNLSLAQEGSQLPGGSGINWTLQNMPKAFNPFR